MIEQTRKKTHEIDIVAIINNMLKEKMTLLVFMGTFLLVGIIYAISKPKAYTTNVVLAPEITSTSGMSQSISDMASSFGIDLGGKSSGMDAIYPDIYPDVLSSTDFVVKLFDIKVREKETPDSTITYLQHLQKQKSKISLSNLVKGCISFFIKEPTDNSKLNSNNSFWISSEDEKICDLIKGSTTCLIDKKTNIITIGYTDRDPLVCAIMADTIQRRLQEYITNYKTKKARNDVVYYQELYATSKQEYTKARQLYAAYSDANEDLLLESFKSKQEDLENDMQLKYNVYTQVASQLQAAKAKLQESTPAFVIVQTSKMPNIASSTPRLYIVILFILLGIIADAVWITWLRSTCKILINKKKNINKQ